MKDQITEILDGIDRDDADGGWWETSTGVEFGTKKLAEILALLDGFGNNRWTDKITPGWVGVFGACLVGIGFLAGFVLKAIL